MEYTIIPIREGMWAIEQKGVRCFLFANEKKAVLIDTGFGGDLLALCRRLTDAPITLVTTHGDMDHIGSDDQFDHQLMHPAEFESYESKNHKRAKAEPLWEGDVIRVGEYRLKVLLIPGHTPGSIALLEERHKFMISGDSVQDGIVFMHGKGRNLLAYAHSMEKLCGLYRSGAFDTVYPSHGRLTVPGDLVLDHLALAVEMLKGDLEPMGPGRESFGPNVKAYGLGRVRMYYERGE